MECSVKWFFLTIILLCPVNERKEPLINFQIGYLHVQDFHFKYCLMEAVIATKFKFINSRC